ncbi:hypothetical protein GCM10027614_08850 [Micromonospora vulcania]
MLRYDYVIVGAGAAGAVLAARLSEDVGRSVLLVEAGPDLVGAAVPEVLRTGSVEAEDGFDWDLRATVVAGREAPLRRGRVVGGSTQINDRGAMRAPAADFVAWGAWPAGVGLACGVAGVSPVGARPAVRRPRLPRRGRSRPDHPLVAR